MVFDPIFSEPIDDICDLPPLGKLMKECLEKEVLCKRLPEEAIWSIAQLSMIQSTDLFEVRWEEKQFGETNLQYLLLAQICHHKKG